MREFTSEMLHTLTEAIDNTRGTQDWRKFVMQADAKFEKGRWFFVGHTLPTTTGVIKTVNGQTYIITDEQTSKTRYHVSDAVKELLGI